MSNYRQWQRMALEDLSDGHPKDRPFAAINGHVPIFLLGGKPLEFCGVSTGVGDCSQKKGLNIACFSTANTPKRLKKRLVFDLKNCAYAAFLHPGTTPHPKRGVPMATVGLIRLVNLERQGTEVFCHMSLSRRQTEYVKTI